MGSSMKWILIVDDDPNALIVIKELVRCLLREINVNPVEILTASSGEEGIAINQRHSINLMITDYYMPGINGLELIRSIRAVTRNIKTILMSSEHDLLHRYSIACSGEIDAVLEKPVSRSGLKKIIQGFLSDPIDAEDANIS